MKVRRGMLALFALPMVAGGCAIGDLLGLTGVAPSLIAGPDGYPVPVVVPDTVTHGVAFAVQITASGSSCIPGTDRTEVRYTSTDTAEIRPYDRTKDYGCGDAIGIPLLHTASLTFKQAGTGVLRFIGDKGASLGRGASRSAFTIERSVVVR